MKILIKITIIFFLFTNISNADLIKPNNKLKPFDVLMIQLNSLKNNNNFYKDPRCKLNYYRNTTTSFL